MRKILPRRSLVFDDDFCASNGDRPLRSSEGLKPSDSNGLVLSPVERNKFPSAANASDPPVWQHVSRCVATSRSCFSEVMSILFPSNTKRDRTFTDLSGCE